MNRDVKLGSFLQVGVKTELTVPSTINRYQYILSFNMIVYISLGGGLQICFLIFTLTIEEMIEFDKFCQMGWNHSLGMYNKTCLYWWWWWWWWWTNIFLFKCLFWKFGEIEMIKAWRGGGWTNMFFEFLSWKIGGIDWKWSPLWWSYVLIGLMQIAV